MKTLGLIIIVPLLTLYLIFSFGYAISWLWFWFVSPLGVANIGVLQSYGLAVLISMFIFKPNLYKEDRQADLSKVCGALIYPWFSLLIGYIVYHLQGRI
jgi:hypothetical protein